MNAFNSLLVAIPLMVAIDRLPPSAGKAATRNSIVSMLSPFLTDAKCEVVARIIAAETLEELAAIRRDHPEIKWSRP